MKKVSPSNDEVEVRMKTQKGCLWFHHIPARVGVKQCKTVFSKQTALQIFHFQTIEGYHKFLLFFLEISTFKHALKCCDNANVCLKKGESRCCRESVEREILGERWNVNTHGVTDVTLIMLIKAECYTGPQPCHTAQYEAKF